MINQILKQFENILETQVYAVGGCVRDHVMGNVPKDIDITSRIRPDEVLKICKEKNIKAYDVGGEKYGTIVILFNNRPYEHTTFRQDINQDGRHTEVIYGDRIEFDLLRRDFTCNSLAMDSSGQILDYCGGIDDIKEGILRTNGNVYKRFKEDYLRIIRACRFAARYDWWYMHEDIVNVGYRFKEEILKNVSIERIKQEFDKAFEDDHPSEFIINLAVVGIMEIILPEVFALKGLRQQQDQHPEGDVLTHTIIVLDNTPKQYRWSALLHDVGKATTYQNIDDRHTYYGHDKEGIGIVEQIADRFKFSNDLKEECMKVCGLHMQPYFLAKAVTKKFAIRRFILKCGKHLEAVKAVVTADCFGRTDNRWLPIFDQRIEEEKDKINPFVMGRDLIELGMDPGPDMGKVLKEIYELQLLDIIKTKEEAIACIQKWIEN